MSGTPHHCTHPNNSQLLLILPKHFVNLDFLSLQSLSWFSPLSPYHLSAGLCTVSINSHCHKQSPLERTFSSSRLTLSCVWLIPLILCISVRRSLWDLVWVLWEKLPVSLRRLGALFLSQYYEYSILPAPTTLLSTYLEKWEPILVVSIFFEHNGALVLQSCSIK